jgi:ligand-binding sensor domain-containing protein
LSLRHIITACLLFSTCILRAQIPAFYHLSTAEGLSDNNVNIAMRDKNGILWIATTEGLNQFDGNRINTYHKYKYPELADNNIERIAIDDHNRIWIRTNTHYITMLDERRKFHRILVGDTTDPSNITAMFRVNSDDIIVLKGRQHYLQKKNDLKVFEKVMMPFDSLLRGSIGFTYNFDNSTTVYYRGNNLVAVDYAKRKLLMQLHFPGLHGVNYINDDELIAYTRKGDVFYHISMSQKKVIREYRDVRDQYDLPITGELRNVTRIDENRFAFTSFFSGLYILDLRKGKVDHWMHDPVDHRSIGGNNTFNVRYDSSGYLFVTTQTSGLHFYNLKQQQATSKPYFIDDNKEIFDGYIQALTTDNESNLWMGAQDRLIKWDRSNDRTSYIPCFLPDGTNISGKETFRAIQIDETGQFWVGTSRYGLLILDKKLRTITRVTDSVPGKRTDFPSAWINAICTDKDGNKWIGTLRGTCIIDGKNFGVISLKDHPLLAEMSRLPCASLWKDEIGNMWIGTTRGAWCYNPQQKSISNYSIREGLFHNTVSAINQDDQGNTYFATSGGLSILSKDKKITSYNRSNGLRNDRCEGILKDSAGFMWIGNLNCILRYDPVNKKFAVFEEGAGFSHAGFRMRSSHKGRQGEMFWGTDRGITYFFPAEMSSVSLPLQPHVNTLQAGDQLFHFTAKEQIRFPYSVSSFVFSFSSGELTGDKRNQLLCRLTGFDNDWKSPAITGQSVYSNLSHGSYLFEMKASRDGIHWYQAPYPVEIIISRPWWQQTWFRILCALTIAGIGWLIYSYLQRRKKNKMEVMQLNLKMAESKLMNLRLQMNPHFLFNSLSSIQHLIVSQQANKAYRYLTVFSNFLRSLLNYAEKNFIPLDEELKILNMYVELESLRFDQSFSWEIQVDESLANDEVLVPSLMIQPFAENAIWHGLMHKEGVKKLTIRFSNNADEYLTCVVEDNGVGRERSKLIRENNINSMVHESKGIGIIQERLRLLEEKTGKPATLTIEDVQEKNNEVTGTRVIITIPYYNPEEI